MLGEYRPSHVFKPYLQDLIDADERLNRTIQEKVAKELGLSFTAELYGDVKYSKDGKLVIDRKKKPWTPEETKKHVEAQILTSSVTAVTGEQVELPIGDYDVSMCCHSDSPGALDIVTAARQIVDKFNKDQGYA